jgi:hypothetical protein
MLWDSRHWLFVFILLELIRLILRHSSLEHVFLLS